MNKVELARTGRQLAAQLDVFNVGGYSKSDDYTGLSWEADILRAKARDLDEGCGLASNLRSSVLVSYCSPDLLSRIAEIVDQIRAFHVAYEKETQILIFSTTASCISRKLAAMTGSGLFRPIVHVSNFSISATCYVELNSRDRPKVAINT